MRCEGKIGSQVNILTVFFSGDSSSSVCGVDEAHCRRGWQRRCAFPGVQKFSCPSQSKCVFLGRRNLMMMALTHRSRDVPVVKGNVSMLCQLLSVVSTGPTIVCCGGADSDFIKALDRDPTRKGRREYPFSLNPVQVEKPMHKPSLSVLGEIDMFSMLTTLLVCLSGMLVELWVQLTQFLRKVGFIAAMFNSHLSLSLGLSGSCVFKALEDASLDLHSAFLVVQEMLSQWAQIVSYISETG